MSPKKPHSSFFWKFVLFAGAKVAIIAGAVFVSQSRFWTPVLPRKYFFVTSKRRSLFFGAMVAWVVKHFLGARRK